MQERKAVEEENLQKRRVINEKDQTIKVMTEKNLEMSSKINSLEAVVAVKDDLA